ncbi:hypothetical protein SISSUDRAFT_1053423 [Sistotremastrum suecicum HHB10207 ss-3]|uniref:Uncharacterized protein n=1 Tax=Sistotremastrum suecicum HHB10207 ss-3 TaxID=1314776 RepID=A0A165Z8E6_9AGAM|nr:hypothetical protein SISSUDRAFT_1053423 [Sistotremastrum suecicum HHB10207 ss-3]
MKGGMLFPSHAGVTGALIIIICCYNANTASRRSADTPYHVAKESLSSLSPLLSPRFTRKLRSEMRVIEGIGYR